MKNIMIKTLIPIICLVFGNCVFADIEEEVVVITNVPYEASVTKKSSTDSVTMDPVTGSHTGLSTVFTLQTNGGDDYFDYVITSYIDIDGDRVSAFGDDGRLLFAHTTNLPSLTAVNNAKGGITQSKNVFAYPTTLNCSGGVVSSFQTNYKTYGNCYVISVDDATTTDITHTVGTTPVANTYEAGIDAAGSYRATIAFTIISK